MVTKTTDAYVRGTPLEVAVGWIYGLLPHSPLPRTNRTPREALDDAMRPALLGAPCYVTFSGGRDSSAVLAAATSLARREGHELPIPVTLAYPGLRDTDETAWQRLVIDHLKLPEWIVARQPEQSDLLGEAARESLLARGVMWPAAIHTHGPLYGQLSPGSLMTGEGGDATLGLRRGTALTVLRHGRRPSRALLTTAARELLPRRARDWLLRRDQPVGLHDRWLRAAALAEHERRMSEDIVAEPLRYDEGTWFISRRRAFATLVHNQAAHATAYGLAPFDPLLDHGFLAALARSGGRWGYNGRTATMQALFADVLPRAVIARSTKASFNHAYRGSGTIEFARDWDGSGVDTDLVDAERLREVWLSDEPTMATALLLHSAWLASQGTP
ncbi:MAG: hypothetical protein GX596_14120 [Propionibacterium sp.]|nr:hypothetical protein [Propionibacterium sp.]